MSRPWAEEEETVVMDSNSATAVEKSKARLRKVSDAPDNRDSWSLEGICHLSTITAWRGRQSKV